MHRHPLGELGQIAADLTQSDDSKRLVVQLHPHEPFFFPLAGLHRRRRLWNPAGHGHDHRHRMLRSRDGIPPGGIHYYNSTSTRRIGIDII